METIIDQIVNWIKSEVKKANAKGVIVGVSGGIDSAVVAALAKRAFSNESLGIFINVFSSKTAIKNASIIFKETNIKSQTFNMEQELKLISDKLSLTTKDNKNIINGNIISRLRMTLLYSFAQKHNYLVLGTSNLSELTIGYFTKWGDGAADLYPIAAFTKRQVYDLAQLLNVNPVIINAKPSADLWENQSDENELGFSYLELDDFISGREISVKTKQKINQLIERNKHKELKINKFKF